jgi:hypothetical protein
MLLRIDILCPSNSQILEPWQVKEMILRHLNPDIVTKAFELNSLGIKYKRIQCLGTTPLLNSAVVFRLSKRKMAF